MKKINRAKYEQMKNEENLVTFDGKESTETYLLDLTSYKGLCIVVPYFLI